MRNYKASLVAPKVKKDKPRTKAALAEMAVENVEVQRDNPSVIQQNYQMDDHIKTLEAEIAMLRGEQVAEPADPSFENDDTPRPRPYLIALAQLADALAQMEPAEMVTSTGRLGNVIDDLSHVLRQRHPDFIDAVQAVEKQRAEKRRGRKARGKAKANDDGGLLWRSGEAESLIGLVANKWTYQVKRRGERLFVALRNTEDVNGTWTSTWKVLGTFPTAAEAKAACEGHYAERAEVAS